MVNETENRVHGLFIRDDELRERFGLGAEIIIDALDRKPETQKGYATRPLDARYRPAVESWLKEHGHVARLPTDAMVEAGAAVALEDRSDSTIAIDVYTAMEKVRLANG